MNNSKFDYPLGSTGSSLMRDMVCKAALMRWIATHITEQGYDSIWVSGPILIVKESLNFIAKFGGQWFVLESC